MKEAIYNGTAKMPDEKLQIVLELVEKLNSEPVYLVREDNVAYFFNKYNSLLKKLAE